MPSLYPASVRRIAAAALLCCSLGAAFANAPRPDLTISDADRQQVVDTLVRDLDERYIFPEVAQKIDADLHARLKRGEYAQVTSAEAFAKLLTAQMRDIAHDGHLHVEYSAQPVPVDHRDGKPSPEEMAQMTAEVKYFNFGIQKVERLRGNIGYIDLRVFPPPGLAGDAMASAMTLVANTNALIVDMRHNNGGQPEMVALTLSYLFDERTHLNDIYSRYENSTEQFWTSEHVTGAKYGQHKPVYVLTSHRTFSGGEEFCNDLKALERATLIGEATGGGAHPGDFYRLAEHFTAFVPVGRPINPITHGDWEGTGVAPDVKVDADKALDVAQVIALKKLIATTADADQRDDMQHRLADLEKQGVVVPAQ
jgi:C-terminal processing protease CtpA/Prc